MIHDTALAGQRVRQEEAIGGKVRMAAEAKNRDRDGGGGVKLLVESSVS